MPLSTTIVPSRESDTLEMADRECTVYSRYLLGVDPTAEILQRFRSATARIDVGATRRLDTDVVRLVVRHPRLLPFLDAACALVLPTALLRKRLLIALALLETTPSYALRFEAPAVGAPRLAVRVFIWGLSSALHAVVGALFLGWLRIRSTTPDSGPDTGS